MLIQSEFFPIIHKRLLKTLGGLFNIKHLKEAFDVLSVTVGSAKTTIGLDWVDYKNKTRVLQNIHIDNSLIIATMATKYTKDMQDLVKPRTWYLFRGLKSNIPIMSFTQYDFDNAIIIANSLMDYEKAPYRLSNKDGSKVFVF